MALSLALVVFLIFGSVIWKAYRPARGTAPAPTLSELDAEAQPSGNPGELEARLAEARNAGVGEPESTNRSPEQPHVQISHDGAVDERARGASHHTSLRTIVPLAGHVPRPSHPNPKTALLGPKKGAGVQHSDIIGNEHAPTLLRRRPHRSPSSGDYGTMAQEHALNRRKESTISNLLGEDGDVTLLGDDLSSDEDETFIGDDSPSEGNKNPFEDAATSRDDALSGRDIPTAGHIFRQSGGENATEVNYSSVKTQFRWRDQGL